MRTLEIVVNGRQLCTAGVGDGGVLTAIVSCRLAAGRREDLRLEVGGLTSAAAEHIRWRDRRLRAGDEVCIRVAEAEKASRPSVRERSDPAFVENSEKRYVEAAAKRFGWKLVKPRR